MKKERSFRPPQTVVDAVKNSGGDITKLNLPVPLSDLRQMHALLKSENAVDKSDAWLGHGGNAGLMWSRRILRQENILKASVDGDLFIPEVIDIQLGPNIVVAKTDDDCETIAAKFEAAGIPSSFIPTDNGTIAFFAGDAENDYPVTKGLVELPDVQLDQVTMVDESRNKLTSIFKVAEGVTGVRCSQLTELPGVVDTAWSEAYLLKAIDSPSRTAKIIKVDDELGLVLGWAIICTVDDEPYFDKQDDYIPDHGMLEAATDFMQSSRVAKEMHVGDQKGTIVFAWPMTAEIAKAFDIEVHQTGLMIAMKPDNDEILEKFRDGTYNGFSIGGERIPEFTEEVE